LHYHYANREEIIRVLYEQLRDEASLEIEALPKNISTLNDHHALLIEVQWKYRFFFRELLFLFARDEKLRVMYVEDNIAHRIRIKRVMQNLIDNGEMQVPNEEALDHLVDSILMAWQFYISYMYTLGQCLDEKGIKEFIAYTNQSMQAYRTDKTEGQK